MFENDWDTSETDASSYSVPHSAFGAIDRAWSTSLPASKSPGGSEASPHHANDGISEAGCSDTSISTADEEASPFPADDKTRYGHEGHANDTLISAACLLCPDICADAITKATLWQVPCSIEEAQRQAGSKVPQPRVSCDGIPSLNSEDEIDFASLCAMMLPEGIDLPLAYADEALMSDGQPEPLSITTAILDDLSTFLAA